MARVGDAKVDDGADRRLGRELSVAVDDVVVEAVELELAVVRVARTAVVDGQDVVHRAGTRVLRPAAAVAEALVARATGGDDPTVRARATWSLISQADTVEDATLDVLLADPDPDARRFAVDLAGAAGYTAGLTRISVGDDRRLARLATLLQRTASCDAGASS